MARRWVRLTHAEELSPTVRGLTLCTVDGQPLAHAAGQWVDVHLSVRGEAMKRAYSIASAPGNPAAEAFDLAVTRVEGGAVSTALHRLSVGETLEIDGPHGFFCRELPHRQAPALFVGTGSGLAPLRAMLQEEVETPVGPQLRLLFGCRTQDDVLWRHELEAWQRKCPRLSVLITLSRADAQWSGRRGYVQAHVAEIARALSKNEAGESVRPQVYICGLSKMVQEVRRVLKADLGFDRKQLQSERYD